MEFEILLQNGDKALLSAKNQYIVADGFQGSEWSYGGYYTHWEREDKKASKLAAALDRYRELVEDEYVSYARLQELASKFAEGLLLDDEPSADAYFLDNCSMTWSEQKFLGIDCKCYMVIARKPCGEKIYPTYHTKSPHAAVEKWFGLNKEYPMCVAIVANNRDAKELLEWSAEHEADVRKLYENGCHYKWDYFIEAVKRYAKSIEDKNPEGCDMVFPFCVG